MVLLDPKVNPKEEHKALVDGKVNLAADRVMEEEDMAMKVEEKALLQKAALEVMAAVDPRAMEAMDLADTAECLVRRVAMVGLKPQASQPNKER